MHAVEAEPGEDADAVLARAAAVEAASEHPVAAAIVAAARERGLPLAAVTDFANDPGTGVRGRAGRNRRSRSPGPATPTGAPASRSAGTVTGAG